MMDDTYKAASEAQAKIGAERRSMLGAGTMMEIAGGMDTLEAQANELIGRLTSCQIRLQAQANRLFGAVPMPPAERAQKHPGESIQTLLSIALQVTSDIEMELNRFS